MNGKLWLFKPIGLIFLVLIPSITIKAIAADISSQENSNLIEDYGIENEDNSLGQVNNVSQLRDVSPEDWAYEALQSLVERYGCIVGYPNGTYRGNKSLSRYEFAAGLNACMNQIERLISSSESVMREDLDKLQRLTQEFQAELSTLATKVDNLEGRTKFLEDNQFSTTTKLTGESVFGLSSVLTGDNANGGKIEKVPVLGNRTRLNLYTSFTGKDTLYTLLSAGNLSSFNRVTNTAEGDLGFYQFIGENNDLFVQTLYYSFPIGDSTTVFIEPFGGFVYDFTDTISFLDRYDDSASGAISLFGVRNPIYNLLFGTGGGIKTQLGGNFEASLGYLADANRSSQPSEGSGLFNGPYSAIAQLAYKQDRGLKLGLTYVHSYNNLDTFTGSNLSRFGSFTADRLGTSVPTKSDSYGVEASWQISDRIVIGGWTGYTKATTLSSLSGTVDRGTLDILNWAVTLAFPDLGKKGNLGGIVVGMEPKVTDSTVAIPGIVTEDRDTSLHFEAFYQYKLNNNIAITPGVVWVTAPDHKENNNDIVIGTIRTTFTF